MRNDAHRHLRQKAPELGSDGVRQRDERVSGPERKAGQALGEREAFMWPGVVAHEDDLCAGFPRSPSDVPGGEGRDGMPPLKHHHIGRFAPDRRACSEPGPGKPWNEPSVGRHIFLAQAGIRALATSARQDRIGPPIGDDSRRGAPLAEPPGQLSVELGDPSPRSRPWGNEDDAASDLHVHSRSVAAAAEDLLPRRRGTRRSHGWRGHLSGRAESDATLLLRRGSAYPPGMARCFLVEPK